MCLFDLQRCHLYPLECNVASLSTIGHEIEKTLNPERGVCGAKSPTQIQRRFVEFHQIHHSPENIFFRNVNVIEGTMNG